MFVLTDEQRRRLDQFLIYCYGIGAIRVDTVNRFELAADRNKREAPQSPTYFNFRTADKPTNPGKMQSGDLAFMAELMASYAVQEDLQFDGICGIPNAGTPLAESLQDCLYRQGFDRPLITLRKGGTLQRTQGLPRQSRILLVDDVISGGESKLREGVDPLVCERYQVVDVLVFVDRQQGGGVMLANAHGINLRAVLTASYIFGRLHAMRVLTPSEFEAVKVYHAA